MQLPNFESVQPKPEALLPRRGLLLLLARPKSEQLDYTLLGSLDSRHRRRASVGYKILWTPPTNFGKGVALGPTALTFGPRGDERSCHSCRSAASSLEETP